MTSKPTLGIPSKPDKIQHPGMMGDGTEEQNLNEKGDPALRIKPEEVDAAFATKPTQKP